MNPKIPNIYQPLIYFLSNSLCVIKPINAGGWYINCLINLNGLNNYLASLTFFLAAIALSGSQPRLLYNWIALSVLFLNPTVQ